MAGERGSMDCFSCIEDTIFSRSGGRSGLSLQLFKGGDDDGSDVSLEGEMVTSDDESNEDACVDASEARVDVLEDKSGTSLRKGLDIAPLIVDVAIDRDALGWLHNVCRPSVLQSMFSNRGPLSRHSALLLFEMTVVDSN